MVIHLSHHYRSKHNPFSLESKDVYNSMFSAVKSFVVAANYMFLTSKSLKGVQVQVDLIFLS